VLRLPTNAAIRRMLRKNPGMKLFALVLAVFLWYSITKTERDAERIIELPVSLRRIPDGLTVTNPPTKAVSVTLRGPRTILDNVDERKSRLQVGLAALQLGDNRVDLTGTMLNPDLPRSLKVVRFDPPSFTLRADKRIMRRLPVKADLTGAPALGWVVSESTVTPDVVEVTGPANVLGDLEQVATEPVDLRGANTNVQRNVLVERRDPSLTYVPDVVRVTVALEEQVVSREFAKVAVAVRGGSAKLTPATIEITVRGPQRLLHNLKLGEGTVFVDVEGLAKGTHTVDVRVEVPEGLSVAARVPERIRAKVEEPS
jgi:YbbR domain-containing protein